MPEKASSRGDLTPRTLELSAQTLANWLSARSPGDHVWITLLLVLLVGAADYYLGIERSLLLFYFLPIVQAAWFVGRKYAVTLAVLSIAIWLAGDLAAGAHFSDVGVVMKDTPATVPVWGQEKETGE